MTSREQLSQQQKHVSFKRAFNIYNQYLDAKKYLGAYVVAFSILEDRIMAMYVTRIRLQNRSLKAYTSLSVKVRYLRKHGDIDKEVCDAWLSVARERNKKIHDAMWNIDEFSSTDCQDLLQSARLADKLRRRQKMKHRE